MNNLSYFDKRDVVNSQKITGLLRNLPSFCYDFIIGIESSTTSLTRLNYCNDLSIFFHFLSQFDKKNNQDYSVEDMEKITAFDIEKFISYLSFYEYNNKQHKNSNSGKKRKLSSVKSLFKYLFNHNLISSNVSSKIATPKITGKEIIRLENKEIENLMKSVENPSFNTKHQNTYNKNTLERDFAIISLFLGTGIRISELVGLNVQDFDFLENAFTVTRKGGNQTLLYFPKSTSLALKNWLTKRAVAEIDKKENAMFLSLQNKRLCVRAVENIVNKFAKQVSPLKKISPHKLRSTFGTELYRKTKDIYIVADILGHKDVNTTKKHYAAISEDMRKTVSSKFDILEWFITLFY